jgi:hypothetical protein
METYLEILSADVIKLRQDHTGLGQTLNPPIGVLTHRRFGDIGIHTQGRKLCEDRDRD